MKFLRKIKESERCKRIVNWIIQACNKNWITAAIVLIIVWGIALIPTWLYFSVRWGISPAGFWEELALLVVACITIGWLQGILLFFAIFGSIGVFMENL